MTSLSDAKTKLNIHYKASYRTLITQLVSLGQWKTKAVDQLYYIHYVPNVHTHHLRVVRPATANAFPLLLEL